MAPTLGYWDIRGLAEPIRLLLHYTETEFKDERYVCGDAPDYSKESWFSVKFTLGLDFPNLPYFIDGDVKITQSNAIMRHIARLNDLCGSTEEEKVRIDIAENQLLDFRNKFTGLCYNPDFEKLKEGYIKDVKTSFQQLSDFLGDRKFVTGDKEYRTRIEELPAIATYRKSDKFRARPLNNKIAQFK